MLKKNRAKKPKMSSEQNTWDFFKKIYRISKFNNHTLYTQHCYTEKIL